MSIFQRFLSKELSRLAEEVADLRRRMDRRDLLPWYPCLTRAKVKSDGLKYRQWVERPFATEAEATAAAAAFWPDPMEDCTYGAVQIAEVKAG